MKRIMALILVISIALCAGGCRKGKEKADENRTPAPPTPTPNEVFEVKLSMENLYSFFDYKEYRADIRDENSSEINSSTIAYGLELKPQYTAANDKEHKDSMTLHFEADGVVLSGDFRINFDDLSFEGTAATSERVRVSEDLHFWAKGNRTTTWAYGNYSSSNIMYLENFRVTGISGSIYLKMADLNATPTPTFIPVPHG